MSKEEIQKIIANYNLLEEYAKNLNNQLELLEQLHNETTSTIAALKSEIFKDKEHEILAPLGSGVYIKVKIIERNNTLVNIGRNILLEKNITETINYLEKRLRNVDNQIIKLKDELNKVTNQLEEYRSLIERISRTK